MPRALLVIPLTLLFAGCAARQAPTRASELPKAADSKEPEVTPFQVANTYYLKVRRGERVTLAEVESALDFGSDQVEYFKETGDETNQWQSRWEFADAVPILIMASRPDGTIENAKWLSPYGPSLRYQERHPPAD